MRLWLAPQHPWLTSVCEPQAPLRPRKPRWKRTRSRWKRSRRPTRCLHLTTMAWSLRRWSTRMKRSSRMATSTARWVCGCTTESGRPTSPSTRNSSTSVRVHCFHTVLPAPHRVSLTPTPHASTTCVQAPSPTEATPPAYAPAPRSSRRWVRVRRRCGRSWTCRTGR